MEEAQRGRDDCFEFRMPIFQTGVAARAVHIQHVAYQRTGAEVVAGCQRIEIAHEHVRNTLCACRCHSAQNLLNLASANATASATTIKRRRKMSHEHRELLPVCFLYLYLQHSPIESRSIVETRIDHGKARKQGRLIICLLYTSDAADE